MSRRSSEITSVDWYSRDVIRVRESQDDASILSTVFFPLSPTSFLFLLSFVFFSFSFFFFNFRVSLPAATPARNRVQSARNPERCGGFVATESFWSRTWLAALNSPFGESLVALARAQLGRAAHPGWIIWYARAPPVNCFALRLAR